jgi:predicted NBD/HSP70 family sugar kinase
MRKINTRSFVRATRTTTRDINRRILLNLVREQQPISRAELARRMQVGRGMVTSLVDELLRDGAIYEGTTVDAPRGRRPMMLYVRTRDRFAVAIDIRLSRTYVMLSDLGGRSLAMETFDTLLDPAAFVATVARIIPRLLKTHRATRKCNGIGLVVPGMVDQRTGQVLNAPQLGWRNVDVRDALADATGLPVHIENASVACALAHMWLGTGDDAPRDFVYVTVSDGVGAGIVVNGEVVRGHDNSAGEFGHVPIDPAGPLCLCGSRGCLEAHTSNLATLSRYLGKEFTPGQAKLLLDDSGLTIADVIERARDGEPQATAALQETARQLGKGLAVIVNALNPSRIFIGGEITDAWDQLLPILSQAIAERALTTAAATTPLIPDSANSHPRLRGATALVAAPLFAAPPVA